MHPQRNLIEAAMNIAEDSQSAGYHDYDMNAAEDAHENAVKNDSKLHELRADRKKGTDGLLSKLTKINSGMWTSITGSSPEWDISKHGPRITPVYGKRNREIAGNQYGTGTPINVMPNSRLIRTKDMPNLIPELNKVQKEHDDFHANHPATARENELEIEHNPLAYHTRKAAVGLIGYARAVAVGGMRGKTPREIGSSIAGLDLPANSKKAVPRGAISGGEIDDHINSAFKDFNAHPVHGGTVPYDRFRGHVLDEVEDRRG